MPEPLHPAIVHVPLGLAIVLPLLAIALTVALWRGFLPPRAFLAVVFLQAALVAGTALGMRTGEAEEHRVETYVPHAAVEAHEDAASVFLWAAVISLAFGLAAVALPSVRARKWMATVTTAASIAVAVLALRVGHEGGELVYRHGAAAAYVETTESPERAAGPVISRAGESGDDTR